jgi:hypothetical protein
MFVIPFTTLCRFGNCESARAWPYFSRTSFASLSPLTILPLTPLCVPIPALLLALSLAHSRVLYLHQTHVWLGSHITDPPQSRQGEAGARGTLTLRSIFHVLSCGPPSAVIRSGAAMLDPSSCDPNSSRNKYTFPFRRLGMHRDNLMIPQTIQYSLK